MRLCLSLKKHLDIKKMILLNVSKLIDSLCTILSLKYYSKPIKTLAETDRVMIKENTGIILFKLLNINNSIQTEIKTFQTT